MKVVLFLLILFPVYGFGKVLIGGVETDQFGDRLSMSYRDAQKHCENKNQRLPTGREFLEEAEASIIETSLKDCKFSDDEERLVYGCYRQIDDEMKSIPVDFLPFFQHARFYGGWTELQFYYKIDKLQKPLSKYAGVRLWTSSPSRFAGVVSGNPDTPTKHVVFYPDDGFSDDWNYNSNSFRCAVDLPK